MGQKLSREECNERIFSRIEGLIGKGKVNYKQLARRTDMTTSNLLATIRERRNSRINIISKIFFGLGHQVVFKDKLGSRLTPNSTDGTFDVNEVSNYVRKHRIMKRLSQKGLSRKSGVSLHMIDRIESKKTEPALSHVAAIMIALGFEMVVEPVIKDCSPLWRSAKPSEQPVIMKSGKMTKSKTKKSVKQTKQPVVRQPSKTSKAEVKKPVKRTEPDICHKHQVILQLTRILKTFGMAPEDILEEFSDPNQIRILRKHIDTVFHKEPNTGKIRYTPEPIDVGALIAEHVRACVKAANDEKAAVEEKPSLWEKIKNIFK